jgi:diadenosine tetraphosphate (Ap4A) HIT family hydrolase
MSQTLIHQRVASARDGTNPTVIARMRSGWAVIGDREVVRGYSLLLPDPVVPHLNALPPEARGQFLQDMALLGDVLLEITNAVRINYEMLGNLEPALHAHLFPRGTTRNRRTFARARSGRTTGHKLRHSTWLCTRHSWMPCGADWRRAGSDPMRASGSRTGVGSSRSERC